MRPRRTFWQRCFVVRMVGFPIRVVRRNRIRRQRRHAGIRAELEAFRQERAALLDAWKADVLARWQARAKRRQAEADLPPGKRKHTPNRPPKNP